MAILQSDDPNDEWARKYEDGNPVKKLGAETRRRFMNELVERESITSVKHMHERMGELFGQRQVAGYEQVRRDVLNLNLIMVQGRHDEWRFRQPNSALPADLDRELMERLKVDTWGITRVSELCLRIDTNPGVATAVHELLKAISKSRTSRPGIMLSLTDNYDTVAIWCATKRHAEEWHEWLSRQLL